MPFIKDVYWNIKKKNYELLKSIHELKSIGIEITNACNLHCKHCYMNSIQNKFKDNLTQEEWINFFIDLRKNFGNKVLIQITGGEPLIREDIFIILKELKNLGFKISLATNGVLLDDQKLDLLSPLLTSLSISLDGFSNSHNYLRDGNTYDKVLENIKKLTRHNIEYLSIKTVIYKKNIEELAPFYQFLKTLKIDLWHVLPMELLGRGVMNKQEELSNQEYEKLCSFIDKIKKDKDKNMRVMFGEEADYFMSDNACDCLKYKLCSAGISSCGILYNGDVVNCIQEDRSTLSPQGNIKIENFKNIWDNKFLEHRSLDYRYCINHKK
ncbi:MAG: radical SAM protein [Candidatus Pacebacteria bacterium]|nr:radical SAM protein [Candidatus Paceibacterota bacterium]